MRRRITAFAVGILVGGTLLTTPADAAETAVAAANFEFNPAEVQVEPGDTVTWTNGDPEPHTVSADDGSFSLLVNPGESVSHVFDGAGAVPYYCKLHGAPGGEGMAGVVQVGSVDPPATIRLAGADNVARAIAWSRSTYPDGASFALLGRSDGFADSLSTGGVQGKLHAPLLLTASDGLDARVRAELSRLQVQVVYLFGGTSALSAAVADQLTAAGYTVRRVAGTDRLLTATAAAETFMPEATSAIIVRGFGDAADPTRAFADSLAAGSAASRSGEPLLFSTTAALSPATRSYLEQHPISSVTLVGGTAALSDQVQADLEAMEIEVERVAGFTRADTARNLAGDGGTESVVVDGSNADGWVDGFAAAGRGGQVLVSAGDILPGATAQALAFTDESVGIVCGTTVTATACDRAEDVRDLELDFPTLGAFVDDDPATEAVAGASGLYPVPNGTDLCYDAFAVFGDIEAASIHRAIDDSTVVTMALEPATENDPFGCSFGLPAATVADIVANPGDYYTRIETADGAVEGPISNMEILGIAAMLGEAEVPGPGDADGVGFGFLFAMDTPGLLCGGMFTDGLSADPTAAHLHQGAAGASGPVALTLLTPPNGGPSLGCYDAGEALISSIRTAPGDFYLNVHTAAFPSGAVRGQLISFG